VSDDELVAPGPAFHDLLLEYSEDAIVVFDPEWRVRVWNKGAERMYGWSADEVLGRPVPNFMPMNLSPQVRADLRRVIIEDGRWRDAVTLQGKDGSTVSVEIVSGVVRDSHGEIAGFVSIHREVSERERAEQAP
jgi:PAS domain S-box-containing protein